MGKRNSRPSFSSRRPGGGGDHFANVQHDEYGRLAEIIKLLILHAFMPWEINQIIKCIFATVVKRDGYGWLDCGHKMCTANNLSVLSQGRLWSAIVAFWVVSEWAAICNGFTQDCGISCHEFHPGRLMHNKIHELPRRVQKERTAMQQGPENAYPVLCSTHPLRIMKCEWFFFCLHT